MESAENMMTTEDVANYLKVDVVTVRRLVSRRQLAAYRVGSEFRFTISDLQDYLKRQYVPVGALSGFKEDKDQRFGPFFLLHEIYGSLGKGRTKAKPAIGERFTERAKAALELSQQEAERQHCGRIYASHLLLGLAAEPAGLAGRALRELGVTAEKIREVLAADPRLTGPARDAADMLGIDPEVKKALERAVQLSNKLGLDTIGTEHLLLGLLWGAANNKAGAVLTHLAVEPDRVRSKVNELMQAAGA